MSKRDDIHKILIIGSGPIIIGQACEFDYSGTQACKALRNLGYEIVLVNSNPATIMTDPETADKTYIEPLNVERLEQIIAKERPDALLPNLGGQSGLNLCAELNKAGILEKYNVQVVLTGTVRNVVDFGAFVDIGVHDDGLLHVSEMSDRFVKNPADVLKVGDVIEVRIKGVDRKRGRISLTRKTPRN